MNWRRVLFRLWIVGTVLFVLAVAFVSYTEIKEQFDAAAAIAAERPNRPLTDAEVGIGGAGSWSISSVGLLRVRCQTALNKPPAPCLRACRGFAEQIFGADEQGSGR